MVSKTDKPGADVAGPSKIVMGVSVNYLCSRCCHAKGLQVRQPSVICATCAQNSPCRPHWLTWQCAQTPAKFFQVFVSLHVVALVTSRNNIFPVVSTAATTWNHMINRCCRCCAVNTTTAISGKDCSARKWHRVTIRNTNKFC